MLLATFTLYLLFGVISLLIIVRILKESSISSVLLLAFGVRIVVMFLDYYEIVQIPGNGDACHFHETAIDNQTTSDHFVDTNYAEFLTYFYKLTDCSRLLAQFLNVLMGMIYLLYLNNSLKIIGLKTIYRRQLIFIASFMPNLIFFSAILLREAWIEMFLMISIYHFIRWFIARGTSLDLVVSVLAVVGASWMHSGSIFVLFGYIAGMAFYNRSNKTIQFSAKVIPVFAIICIFGGLLIMSSGEFLGKFAGLLGSSASLMEVFIDIYTPKVEAGSTYLTWLNVTSPLQAIIFAPLKMFYFLFSPIPLDWRSIMDVIAFLFDSTIYLCLLYGIYLHRKETNSEKKSLVLFLLISFFFATFILAMGTIASGTAVRHRAKIVAILFVCYGLTKSGKLPNKADYKYEINCI